MRETAEFLLGLINDHEKQLRIQKGNLHVSMRVFVTVRKHINLLVGSVNNWLLIYPAKSSEISNSVAEILSGMQKNSFDEYCMDSFEAAICNGKIGETYLAVDGSYCFRAIQAYRTYLKILCDLIQTHDIPISKRKMPYYPPFDEWLTNGYFTYIDGILQISEEEITEPLDEDVQTFIDDLFKKRQEKTPFVKAFRIKVTSCCRVCKQLDDACRKERKKRLNKC